jgi:hypothetical protein
MKELIKKMVRESMTYDLIESLLDEDYPASFDMDYFKKLKSFNQRVKYCQDNLKRISSGSSRIVYLIDEEKVLKLAKNKKGIAQNEVEIDMSNDFTAPDILAKTFDYDEENSLWVEMELAKKVKASDFKRVVGYDFKDIIKAIHNYGVDTGNARGIKYKYDITPDLYNDMWENTFMYELFNYIGNYGIPVGDLMRLSSYGLVKRDGNDAIAIIDFGLTFDVYDTYYS